MIYSRGRNGFTVNVYVHNNILGIHGSICHICGNVGNNGLPFAVCMLPFACTSR